MITFHDVMVQSIERTKSRDVVHVPHLELPTNSSVALLVESLEDGKAIVEHVSGVFLPIRGRIVRQARVSFPVGSLGGFDPHTTVRDNIAHLARMYRVDANAIVGFTERVSGLAEWFDRLYIELPRIVRRTLGTVVAFSIPFDMYVLSDEITRHLGRNDIVSQLYSARRKSAGVLVPTTDEEFARTDFVHVLELKAGRLRLSENRNSADQSRLAI